MLHWRKGRVDDPRAAEHLRRARRLRACRIEPVFCGGDRRTLQEREQWASGCNFVAMRPGVILSYQRNEATLHELQRMGFRVVIRHVVSHRRRPDRRRRARGDHVRRRRVGARRRRSALHDAVRSCATIPGADDPRSAPPTRCSPSARPSYLAAGPGRFADPHLARLPASRRAAMIAEHMAAALFAGHQRFARDAGRSVASARGSGGSATWGAPTKRRGARVTARGSQLDDESFVVVDVETTGSRAYHGDRITEIAVVRVRDGVVKPVFDTLINPERPIPPIDHGAHEHHVRRWCRHAPRFAEVCDQLLGVLEGHVFVAHNANFDWRFLSAEVERATGRPLIGRRLCTVTARAPAGAAVAPSQPRRDHALTTASTNHARHRAGGDALATARVVPATARRRARSRHRHVDELDRLSRTPSNRRRRRPRPCRTLFQRRAA